MWSKPSALRREKSFAALAEQGMNVYPPVWERRCMINEMFGEKE